MFLTDETDIYTYFEIIEQVEPDRILDVGMFLKRIGSVSRQVKDKEILPGKQLTGVDFFPDFQCPVWSTVYNEIYKPDDFFVPDNKKEYELAILFQMEQYIDKSKVASMWKWLSLHTKYLVTDWNIEIISNTISIPTEKEIRINEKSYRLIFFRELI